jgi:hypothetical protein
VRSPEPDDDFDPNMMAELSDIGAPSHLPDFSTIGIDPSKSTRAKPGTEEKVLMLSARYAAGLDLWHTRDCHDHGPKERDLMGATSGLDPLPLPLPEPDESDRDD